MLQDARRDVPPAIETAMLVEYQRIKQGAENLQVLESVRSLVGPNSAAKDCTMKIVREWLKVNCTGKIVDATMMEGFGKDGFDYFQSVKPGTMADFVVRVKKGGALKLRINREKDRASLFMNWPSGSPKPTIIALQHMAL